VADRLVPGHGEGDFIKGAGKRAAVGTLIERRSRYVPLVRMEGVDAPAALDGFSRAFKAVFGEMRKTLTYAPGKEMAYHAELSRRLELRVFFADPHSPWQRPANENTNGLIRQYLPRGADLSVYSQAQLDDLAWRINNRPHRALDFEAPTEVYDRLINELDTGVALQT
jgi:IS30 family transposase